jgi:site-specific recombinase XerD
MKTFNVSIVADQVLLKLREEGALTPNKLSSVKNVGFRTIVNHFKSRGNLTVDNEILRGFLEKQHDAFCGDKKRSWRWQILRRSAELLMHFAVTGRIDMPPLPKWDKRHCQLYIEPTAEQLSNNDNIYGLTWRVRKKLKQFGYAEFTIRYYDRSGFAKLLNAHWDANTESYSRKLCAQVVLYAHSKVRDGNLHKIQAVRKTAALLDEFHRYGSITPAALVAFDAVHLTPTFESLVDEYAHDALFSGKLGEVTADTAKSILKVFHLDLEGTGFTTYGDVTLAVVAQTVSKTAAEHYKHGAASLLHYVRDFLKYLYDNGLTETNLSVGVPKIAAPFRKIYQGFTDEEIRKLLDAVDRGTSIGKRDYAMMTLAAQTGMRAVDVVGLKRSDIDWRAREINIVQSKTGESLRLSLEAESGNAICDYLLNARQECDLPNVFLNSHYPLRALKRNVTLKMMAKYMALAGIVPTSRQRYGFHSFRRAFGTRLLESGTPVHLLAQLLGHADIDSAKPYMSVSEQGLRECCLPLAPIERGR